MTGRGGRWQVFSEPEKWAKKERRENKKKKEMECREGRIKVVIHEGTAKGARETRGKKGGKPS